VPTDTSLVKVRHFDSLQVLDFQRNAEFQYDRTPPSYTLWDEIKMWLLRKFSKLFSDKGIAPYIRFLLILGLIGFLIWVFLKTKMQGIFVFDRKNSDVEYETLTENIHQLDFDTMIQNEIQTQNFRKATRLLYLKMLKILTDNNLIEWSLHKTNNDYIFELRQSLHYQDFKKLTKYYEFVWYGNFNISKTHFEDIFNSFLTFFKNEKVKN